VSNSASGPLGVLLMIAPLAAIPVLAIVGVPQFAPVSASSADDEDLADLGEPSDSLSPTRSELPRRSPLADDQFEPVPNRPSGAEEDPPRQDSERQRMSSGATAPARSSTRELPPPDALDDWEVRPELPRAAQTQGRGAPTGRGDSKGAREGFGGLPPADSDDGFVSSEGFTPDLLTPDPSRSDRGSPGGVRRGTAGPKANDAGPVRLEGVPPTDDPRAGEVLKQLVAEQTGWQVAARRLKELGVRKYRLESQIEEQQFLFICSLASSGNTRVVRRFEATADNPLEAVQAVLAQIDEWRAHEGATDEATLTLDDDGR